MRYAYTVEKSFVNGIKNALAGVIEGFALSSLIHILFSFQNPFIHNLASTLLLTILIQSFYLILRIFIAFTHMTRLSTVVYYFSFTAAYIWLSIELGDTSMALTIFIAVILSIIIRIWLER